MLAPARGTRCFLNGIGRLGPGIGNFINEKQFGRDELKWCHSSKPNSKSY